MSVGEETRRAVEQAFATIVAPQLSELANRVGIQNGRVGRVENRVDDLDEKINEQDSKIGAQEIAIRDLQMTINAIPTQTADLVRKELKRARTEQDAERYRQLQTLGWKLLGGLVGSSAVLSLIITWLLQGRPLP